MRNAVASEAFWGVELSQLQARVTPVMNTAIGTRISKLLGTGYMPLEITRPAWWMGTTQNMFLCQTSFRNTPSPSKCSFQEFGMSFIPFVLKKSEHNTKCMIHHLQFKVIRAFVMLLQFSRKGGDSAVGISTGYGLDDQEVRVRVPVGTRIFTSPCRPDRLCGPPNLLSNGTGGSFPGGKEAGAWSWPLTSN
jgi:hypothetical protein